MANRTALIKKNTVWLNCQPSEIKEFMRLDGWVENKYKWQLAESQSTDADVKTALLVDFLQKSDYMVVFPRDLPDVSKIIDIERQDRWVYAHEDELGIVFGDDSELFQASKCLGRWDKDQAKRLISMGQVLDLLFFAHDFDFSFTEEAKDLINLFFEGLDLSEIPAILRESLKTNHKGQSRKENK